MVVDWGCKYYYCFYQKGQRWISILDKIFNKKNNIQWIYDCHNGRISGDYISLYHKYMKDVWESLLAAREKGLDLNRIMDEYSYEKKFFYINKSGLDSSVLKKGHLDNLKFTWECINNIGSVKK